MPDGVAFVDQYRRDLEKFAYGNWMAMVGGAGTAFPIEGPKSMTIKIGHGQLFGL
jgi:hypothetical protein